MDTREERKRDMKKIYMCLFLFVIFISYARPVYAEYVLPYPSYMPGNKLYAVSKFIDKVRGVWSFGNIAQLKYRMSLADKYLVEAKTLFEYKQYAFAVNALKRSSIEIGFITPYVQNAQQKGIDMSQFRKLICEQMVVHQLVISALGVGLPESYIWQEEKKNAVDLPINLLLNEAAALRLQVQNDQQCL